MNRNLITPEQAKTFARTMSRHVDTDRIETAIEEAQNIDLKPQIGDALLYDLRRWSENPANAPDYGLLMDGGTYTVAGCEPQIVREIQGIRKALAYYTYARLVKTANQHLSRTGFVQKEDQYSSRAELRERIVAEQEARAVGDRYMAECLAYLRAHRDSFPLFITQRGQQNRLRITAIGK